MLAKKILACSFLLTFLLVSLPLARAESGREISDTHPLNINKPIFRLSVSGRVTFEKESSYFRIVLVDKDLNEYLVYETYPLLADSNSFTFNSVCQETCILNSVSPVSLKIFGEGAIYAIDKISTIDDLQQLRIANIAEEKERVKTQQEEQKIQKLNEQIKVKGISWIAGKTSVSNLSYEEKKKLFRKEDGTPVDRLPNLQGFEYYKGGIFEIKSGSPGLSAAQEASPSALPASWDWRNVHGENWNTPVRDQGSAGTCWAHARTGAFESQINLYYNQHLNIDLSEQMYVDCETYDEKPIGMGNYLEECGCRFSNGNLAIPNYCVLSIHGLPDEKCDPYVGREYPDGPPQEWFCTSGYVCEDWQNRAWRNVGYHGYLRLYTPASEGSCRYHLGLTEVDFKKKIIEKGPADSGFDPWGHSMVLEGYETDSSDNLTVWIYKNSWGTIWGENGYAKIKTDVSNINEGHVPLGPFIPPPDHSYWPAGFDGEIKCVDKDDDGYCNWGTSETKPSTCPESCKPLKDCNDSDPNLGPFDENFNCRFSCQNSAQGDLNCDNLINETDLTILLSRWGQPDGPAVQTLLQNWDVNI